MAELISTLGIKLDASGVQQGARQADKALGGLERKTRTAGSKMAGSFDRAAKSIISIKGALVALGASAVFGALIKSASDFENKMAEVSTLLSDTSSVDMMTESVEALSQAYGASNVQQAGALYQAISAGAEAGAEAIELLDQANKLAIGGVTDVETAVDGLTTAMNVYRDSNLTAAEASDAMFVAMRAGKTTVGELSSSLGKVIPLAKDAGLSFDETAAAIAALTKAGISTRESVTGLRAILAQVAKPSSEAARLAEQLGLNFSISGLQAKGFAQFMKDVKDATGGSTEQMAELFGGVEAIIPALNLAGQAGQDFNEIMVDMENKLGATDVAVERMTSQFEFKFKRAMAAVKDIFIDIGQALIPVINPVLDFFTDSLIPGIRTGLSSVVDYIGEAADEAKQAWLLAFDVLPMEMELIWQDVIDSAKRVFNQEVDFFEVFGMHIAELLHNAFVQFPQNVRAAFIIVNEELNKGNAYIESVVTKMGLLWQQLWLDIGYKADKLWAELKLEVAELANFIADALPDIVGDFIRVDTTGLEQDLANVENAYVQTTEELMRQVVAADALRDSKINLSQSIIDIALQERDAALAAMEAAKAEREHEMALSALLDDAIAAEAALNKMTTAEQKLGNEIKKTTGLTDNQQDALDSLIDSQNAWAKEMYIGNDQTELASVNYRILAGDLKDLPPIYQQAAREGAKNVDQFREMNTLADEVGNTFFDAFERGISSGRELEDVILDLIEALAKLVIKDVMGGGGGFSGLGGGLVSDMFGGGFGGGIGGLISGSQQSNMLAEQMEGFGMFDDFTSGFGDIFSGAGDFLGGLFGFKKGGQFTIDGTGGPDSQLVAFKGTPGETVTVAPPSTSDISPLPMSGQNADANVTVMVNNYSGESAEVTERQTADGGRILEITVGDIVRKMVRSGEFDAPMRAYGNTRTGVAR